MTTTPDLLADVMPSATPTEAELLAWEALPRDEQLRRMQKFFDDPACSKVSTYTMDDILREACAEAGIPHG
jgi:hypothetical protein